MDMSKRLTYRPVGDSGAYPDWLRKLKNASGVYVFRDARSKQILYVGESHSGRLYSTLTRHLQGWTQKLYYSRGAAVAGHTYDRGRVEVAVRTTPPSAAIAHQDKLIRRLRPRDNELFGNGRAKSPSDEVPF